jgi:TRAP-type C4-dicarboxylate transport system permease small subunit
MTCISKTIDRLEEAITMATLSALVVSVLWGVLTRYVTEKPAVWTTELSGILFTWVVFIGAAAAMRRNQHISVPLLVDALPEGIARAVRVVSRLLVILFLFYVTWLSYEMMLKGATRPSPVLRLPFSWVYLATFLAFLEMSVSAALRLFGILPAPEEEDEVEVL